MSNPVVMVQLRAMVLTADPAAAVRIGGRSALVRAGVVTIGSE